MPFKKIRKIKNGNTKEKKAIATRLMVISLKVDDYIYKNKPISVQEAQMYIEEIAMLKLKCVDDVRSLQVSEKLTTFMKCIVKENILSNDPNQNYNNASNIQAEIREQNNTSVSPVNIIINIDNENTVIEDAIDDHINKNNTHHNTSPTDEENINMGEFTNLSIIDHSNMTLANNNANTQIITEKSEVKVIKESSFYKQDIRNDLTEMTVAELNISTNDVVKANAIDNIIEKTFYNDETVKNNGEKLPVSKLNICECSLKNVNETIKNTSTVNNKQDKIKVTTQKSNRKPRNKAIRNNKELTNKITNKDNKSNHTKKITKKNCKVAKKNNITNTDIPKICDPCDKPVQNKLTSKVNKVIEISWVENIKYVREVCKEEYDLTNSLNETFWSDHTLPVDWNFKDFDYTD